MRSFSLPQNGIFNFPSFPLFGQTLKLIETKKNFNVENTLSFFEKNIQHSEIQLLDEENSLELQITNNQKREHQATEYGPTPKKKKTGCICKKTKCLKMYCQCFASGKLCTPQCVCCDCSNHEDCQKQIEKAKESIKQKNQTTVDNLKQFKGCNCKKSQCQKKYCECFNAGIACSEICKCQECANNEGSCSHKSIDSIKLNNQQ